MSDLIGTSETALILRLSRQRVWQLYKDGSLQAVMVLGTPARPRPIFNRRYIEQVAKTRLAERASV